MFFFGKLLDPQPPSDVAVAPGTSIDAETRRRGEERLLGSAHSPSASPRLRAKAVSRWLINVICPGMVLLSFVFSVGAVYQLWQLPNRVHQVIQFTWVTG